MFLVGVMLSPFVTQSAHSAFSSSKLLVSILPRTTAAPATAAPALHSVIVEYAILKLNSQNRVFPILCFMYDTYSYDFFFRFLLNLPFDF